MESSRPNFQACWVSARRLSQVLQAESPPATSTLHRQQSGAMIHGCVVASLLPWSSFPCQGAYISVHAGQITSLCSGHPQSLGSCHLSVICRPFDLPSRGASRRCPKDRSRSKTRLNPSSRRQEPRRFCLPRAALFFLRHRSSLQISSGFVICPCFCPSITELWTSAVARA